MDNKTNSEKYRDLLNKLGNNFDIYIEQNKEKLVDYYSSTDSNYLYNSEDADLDKIFQQTIDLNNKVKNDVQYLTSDIKKRNNKLIQKGIDMAELNKKLDDLKNKSDASEPRKNIYKKTTQQDILIQIAYTFSILGGIFIIYKFYKNM
tara:strand:+ start:1122 stop:1565 length:444 start_codon:yes stop_codon:yes gene_type:complete